MQRPIPWFWILVIGLLLLAPGLTARLFVDVLEGAAVLLVEQHTDLALTVSDRAYVLVHGEVVHSGSSRQLLADRHLLDAAFLGYQEEVR